MVGDLHRLLRSDRRVLDVRGEQTGGGHPKNQRNATVVVFQIQLVHHDSSLTDGEHTSSLLYSVQYNKSQHSRVHEVFLLSASRGLQQHYRRIQINVHLIILY